jgi:hypothetical protein
MPLWPIHLKPNKDELLSSWLTRIAMDHGIRTVTFCGHAFPAERHPIRGLDRTYDPLMMQILAEGTGVSVERAWETSLAFDEGYQSVTA